MHIRLSAAGLGVLLALGACTGDEERDPPGAAGGSPRKNVILILTDDQSMKSLSKMSYLASEPEGSWVRFRNAFLSTPVCCPSRASLLTGRYSYKSGVVTNRATRFADDETLPVWLQRAGYRTGLVGKYLNHFLTNKDPRYIPPGWDWWVGIAGDETGGFYHDYELNIDGELREFGDDPEDYSTDLLTDYAEAFISSSRRPFFLWLGYRAPHIPRIPAPRHEGMFGDWHPELDPSFNEGDVSDKPEWIRRLGRVDAEGVRDDYRREAQALQAVDEGIEALMQTLEDEGKLDETVIVFMTDNGMSLGQHRYLGRHGRKQCPHEPCIRTPLLVRYPGVEEASSSRLVSNIDIAPTIQAIAGASATFEQDGRSLVPLLTGTRGSWRDHILIDWRARGESVPPYQAVRTRRWKYVRYLSGERELYDLKNDPFELSSLHGSRDHVELMRRLDDKLAPLR